MRKRIEGNNGGYGVQDDNRRTLLAQEAARLISDHGIKDFRLAKSKAADIMGLRDKGALPSNREIEDALAERNRIFSGATHGETLRRLRAVAFEVMRDLEPFRPRLVGPVLSGNVTRHSNIDLHLFTDSPEAVGTQLDAHGIGYQLTQHRHRMRRGETESFPAYQFWIEGEGVEATVFPERGQGHAPLSPVDGRPMQRAKLRRVAAMLEEELAAN